MIFKPDVLIVGDLHIHERPEFPAPIGENPRLLDGLNIMDQIAELVFRYKLKYVIFTGDLFELKDKIPNYILVPFAKRIEEIKTCGAEVIALRGNHDFKIPSYATTSIFPSITFIDDVITLNLATDKPGGKFAFIPFYRKEEEFRAKWREYHTTKNIPDVLIFHNELPGVYYSEKKMSTKDEWDFPTFSDKETAYIGGHIHIPQLLATPRKNNHIEYIGTPYPIDFNDMNRDTDNYVLLYEFSNRKTTPFYMEYPKFLEMKVDDAEPQSISVKGNYIRIVGTVEPKDRFLVKDMKENLYKNGARGVQVKVKYNITQTSRIKAEKTDHQGVISQFLKGSEITLDKNRLLQTGLNLLEEVK